MDFLVEYVKIAGVAMLAPTTALCGYEEDPSTVYMQAIPLPIVLGNAAAGK